MLLPTWGRRRLGVHMSGAILRLLAFSINLPVHRAANLSVGYIVENEILTTGSKLYHEAHQLLGRPKHTYSFSFLVQRKRLRSEVRHMRSSSHNVYLQRL